MKYPQKKLILLVISCCVLVSLAGCATITEGIRGFFGTSTKDLEKHRIDARVKSFNYDYFSCFTKTLDILKGMGAYVYNQDIKKQIIAIYVSSSDTTPVGLFFKEVDAAHTQIEVSSPSNYAKEFIAQKLFLGLEEPAH